jgi:circadian clock protein KaiA
MAHLCEMYRRSVPPEIPLVGSLTGRNLAESDPSDAPEVSS